MNPEHNFQVSYIFQVVSESIAIMCKSAILSTFLQCNKKRNQVCSESLSDIPEFPDSLKFFTVLHRMIFSVNSNYNQTHSGFSINSRN